MKISLFNKSIGVAIVGLLTYQLYSAPSDTDIKKTMFANKVSGEIGVLFEPVSSEIATNNTGEAWIGYVSDRDTLPNSDGYLARVERIGNKRYLVQYLNQIRKPVETVVTPDGRKEAAFWTKSDQKKVVGDNFIGIDTVFHPSAYLRDKFDAVSPNMSTDPRKSLIRTLPPTPLTHEVNQRLANGDTLVWVKLPALTNEVLVNIGKDAAPLIDPVTAKTNFFYVQMANPMVEVSLDKADKRLPVIGQNGATGSAVQGAPVTATPIAASASSTEQSMVTVPPATNSTTTAPAGTPITSTVAPSVSSPSSGQTVNSSSTTTTSVVPATLSLAPSAATSEHPTGTPTSAVISPASNVSGATAAAPVADGTVSAVAVAGQPNPVHTAPTGTTSSPANTTTTATSSSAPSTTVSASTTGGQNK